MRAFLQSKAKLFFGAALFSFVDQVKQLIADGVDVNTTGSYHYYDPTTLSYHYYDRSALLAAICSGHEDVANLLIANGADTGSINIRGDNGNMPLHEAIHENDEILIKRLLAYGARSTQ